MTSGYKVIWSAEATKNLDHIIHYLKINWSEKEIRKFFKKLEKALTLISSRPLLFRQTNKRERLHKCVLTKQTSLYYQLDRDTIFIIALFDNRQNPEKLKQ